MRDVIKGLNLSVYALKLIIILIQCGKCSVYRVKYHLFLQTIIPEEVKEEVAETLSGTALESVMDYDMEEVTTPDNIEEMEGKDKKDEPKQDDEDIVDLGKER